MLVQQQVQDVENTAEDEDEDNEVSAEPTPPSPTPATSPLSSTQEHIPSPPQAQTAQLSSPPPQQSSQTTDILKYEDASKQGEEIAELDADKDVTLVDAEEDMNANDFNESEPAEVEEVIEVVTAAKLMTEVVTTATTTITAAQVPKASAPRRRRSVVIQDPKETATASVIMHTEVNSKDKGNGILTEEPKPLKRQARKNMMIYLKNMAGFQMDFFKVNDDDDVFTEATPLASKVPVVDYQIHHENNKPYYKIIKADGTHKLFLSFITLLKNFDREDLEMLWKLV
nr:hypothetical protein [Tanacetum cinerariifolium]GFA59691.1 hypothetical protein [Tanacetum cinerariifolium]